MRGSSPGDDWRVGIERGPGFGAPVRQGADREAWSAAGRLGG